MKQFTLFSLFFLFLVNISNSQQWGLYTLYATKNGTKAYLIDTANTPVTYHDWTFPSSKRSAYSCYLVPGDTLVRTYSYTGAVIGGGAITGGVQKVLWNGTVVWDFVYSSSTYVLHHDICPLPNGNVLMISYDVKTSADATQAGCSSSSQLYSEKIIEVKPTGATTGEIVWEWKLWDHLCQNYNSLKDNYVSSIIDNPQLLNINYEGTGLLPDRWHMNGLDYNEELDQIAISMHFMNSAFIIDHSTNMSEAAGHTGGNSGKGGDFLYRWGNPASYGASGTTIFNTIHDAHWVPSDNPNFPDYLCAYNNNGGVGGKTCVDIWEPPYDGYNYSHTAGTAYTPSTYDYRYTATFTVNNEGNSHQLPNGNMLVNNFQGSIYEVNSAGTTLWTKSGANSSHAYRYSKCYVRGPVVSANTSENQVCLGEAANLNSSAVSVTETSPSYSYIWSSGETSQNITVYPNENTIYTVTITNTAIGCSATSSVNIIVLENPETPIISQMGSSLSSSSAASYQWYLEGVPIVGAISQTYSPIEDGNYSVEISDENDCSAISEEFIFSGSDINENMGNNLSVYPNPTTGLVNIVGINYQNINSNVEIFDLSGKNILKIKITPNLDLSVFENGIYFLLIENDGNRILQQKVVLIK